MGVEPLRVLEIVGQFFCGSRLRATTCLSAVLIVAGVWAMWPEIPEGEERDPAVWARNAPQNLPTLSPEEQLRREKEIEAINAMPDDLPEDEEGGAELKRDTTAQTGAGDDEMVDADQDNADKDTADKDTESLDNPDSTTSDPMDADQTTKDPMEADQTTRDPLAPTDSALDGTTEAAADGFGAKTTSQPAWRTAGEAGEAENAKKKTAKEPKTFGQAGEESTTAQSGGLDGAATTAQSDTTAGTGTTTSSLDTDADADAESKKTLQAPKTQEGEDDAKEKIPGALEPEDDGYSSSTTTTTEDSLLGAAQTSSTTTESAVGGVTTDAAEEASSNSSSTSTTKSFLGGAAGKMKAKMGLTSSTTSTAAGYLDGKSTSTSTVGAFGGNTTSTVGTLGGKTLVETNQLRDDTEAATDGDARAIPTKRAPLGSRPKTIGSGKDAAMDEAGTTAASLDVAEQSGPAQLSASKTAGKTSFAKKSSDVLDAPEFGESKPASSNAWKKKGAAKKAYASPNAAKDSEM